jgi:hypothetical protein
LKMERKLCPKCGTLVLLNAKYCTNCGYTFTDSIPQVMLQPQMSPMTAPTPKVGRSGMLTASAVLVIVGSVIAFIGGVFGFVMAASVSSYGSSYTATRLPLAIGLGALGFLGFSLGLVAGIESLRRKQFALSISGVAILLAAGTLHFTSGFFPYSAWVIFVLFFGIPITTLTVLGLTFLAVRRKEFT